MNSSSIFHCHLLQVCSVWWWIHQASCLSYVMLFLPVQDLEDFKTHPRHPVFSSVFQCLSVKGIAVDMGAPLSICIWYGAPGLPAGQRLALRNSSPWHPSP